MAQIIEDNREQMQSAAPFFPAAIDKNNKKYQKLTKEQGGGDIEFKRQRVTTGDYHILFNDQIYMSIERKTWKDLAASIKDGRMNSQHKQMENYQLKRTQEPYILLKVLKKEKIIKLVRLLFRH